MQEKVANVQEINCYGEQIFRSDTLGLNKNIFKNTKKQEEHK